MNLFKEIVELIKAQSVYLLTFSWLPYSRIIFPGDSSKWVIWWERKEVINIAEKLGYHVFKLPFPPERVKRQSIYYGVPYFILNDNWLKGNHRIGFDYFHGTPDVDETFALIFRNLKKNHPNICRIRVSNSIMQNYILETGIDPEKVYRIPIAINLKYFPKRTNSNKNEARKVLGIPKDALVVGSFQKDGEGWGEGEKAKLIKGPDIFVKTIKRLHSKFPEMMVLLSGPARGFVKKELSRADIQFKHVYIKNYKKIWRLYHAIDLYIVTSRIEGGPKAILESMACGIPLITTNVGQAVDLVRHGENAWIAESENIDELYHLAKFAIENKHLTDQIIDKAYQTAISNTYESQIDLWDNFFCGFTNK